MFSNPVQASVGDDRTDKEKTPSAPDATQSSPRFRKLLSLWLLIFGVASLTFLLGAAVIHFELPTSGFLVSAFKGAEAWKERQQAPASVSNEELDPVVGKIDKPDKTFDGFTLYAYASMTNLSTQAFLINMRGEVVHKWAVSPSDIRPDPMQIDDGPSGSQACAFGCYLYPNGDLLVVLHALARTGRGYGLVKLDKDSNVLWKYAANAHHDVDVGEDGTIYAIKHENVYKAPKGLEFIQTPCLLDYLVVLSPEGEEIRKPIPILEAFRDSPYAPLLSSLERQGKHSVPPGVPMPRIVDDSRRRGDPLHTNSVKVLTRELASQFPRFKAGQVLISMRNLDAIAMLDLDKGAVVWAARGSWLAQHDAQYLDNGHLLIFDNLGSPKGSRVIEYDPQSQAIPWAFSGENKASFFTSERGLSQRLPNGNTLICISEPGEVLEVTQNKEVVWSFSVNSYVTTARRYGPEQVRFLTGDQRARP